MFKKLIERIQAYDTGAGAGTGTGQPATVPLELAAAALLMEVASADQQVTHEELAQIQRSIRDTFALDQRALDELIAESRETVAESVGVQPLTRALTEHWTEPQRFDLVLALWRVALADQAIDALEEHRIRAIADLLYVSHARFIEAKLKAKRSAAD